MEANLELPSQTPPEVYSLRDPTVFHGDFLLGIGLCPPLLYRFILESFIFSDSLFSTQLWSVPGFSALSLSYFCLGFVFLSSYRCTGIGDISLLGSVFLSCNCYSVNLSSSHTVLSLSLLFPSSLLLIIVGGPALVTSFYL
jgi:hypothetical protein